MILPKMFVNRNESNNKSSVSKLEYMKGYNKRNRDKQLEYNEQYRTLNKDKLIKKEREYYRKNREIIRIKAKERNRKNRWKRNIYLKKRMERDISFKITHHLRTRLNRVLKRNPKMNTTMNLVGCSKEYLVNYLESQFDDEMSWGNYGKWHIDHIIPCFQFDLSKGEEQKKCFNFNNLRPLWAEYNYSRPKKVLNTSSGGGSQ